MVIRLLADYRGVLTSEHFYPAGIYREGEMPAGHMAALLEAGRAEAAQSEELIMFCSIDGCENAVTEVSGPGALPLCQKHKFMIPEALKALRPVENKMVQPVSNKALPVAIDATDAAIALAARYELDLTGIQGSGAGGRIVKTDVQAIVDALPPAPEPVENQ